MVQKELWSFYQKVLYVKIYRAYVGSDGTQLKMEDRGTSTPTVNDWAAKLLMALYILSLAMINVVHGP